MDRQEFETALRSVEPGQFADVPYEVFELLFPPGVQDDNAKAAAYTFARDRGFHIENRPDKGAVWFVKDNPERGSELG